QNIDHLKEIRQGNKAGEFHGKPGRLFFQAEQVLVLALARKDQLIAFTEDAERFDGVVVSLVGRDLTQKAENQWLVWGMGLERKLLHVYPVRNNRGDARLHRSQRFHDLACWSDP